MTTDYDEIRAERKAELVTDNPPLEAQLRRAEAKWRTAADDAIDLGMPVAMVEAFDNLADAFRRARHAVAGGAHVHAQPVKVTRRISANTLHHLADHHGIRPEAMGTASELLQNIGDDRKVLALVVGALISTGELKA